MHREPLIHFSGPPDLLARQAVLDTLSNHGIATCSLDINAPSDEGIICFSSINDDLYDLVREVSHNPDKRVLAVPFAGAKLDNAQAWRSAARGGFGRFSLVIGIRNGREG
jgi:hypothetical protein